MAMACEACQERKPENQKEPLQQLSDGFPWQKIGTDIFEIQGRNNLVCVDFHSNFVEVDYLSPFNSDK